MSYQPQQPPHPFQSESQRYDYPLGPDSIVVDAGGYQGAWADEIQKRYGCRVLIFEPVPLFMGQLCDRLLGRDRFEYRSMALGGSKRSIKIHVQNDSTGAFAGSSETVDAMVYDVRDLVTKKYDHVDLLKLNIEGMEYEVLDAIIVAGLAAKFHHIQVQFHTCAPDYLVKHAMIHKALSLTHVCTWHTEFVWTNWSLRK